MKCKSGYSYQNTHLITQLKKLNIHRNLLHKNLFTPLESCLLFKHTCFNCMRIASFELTHNVFVAPMAGVTDRPFRMLCKQLGAAYAVSEMVTSRKDLWDSLKTSRRANHEGETGRRHLKVRSSNTPTKLLHLWTTRLSRHLSLNASASRTQITGISG